MVRSPAPTPGTGRAPAVGDGSERLSISTRDPTCAAVLPAGPVWWADEGDAPAVVADGWKTTMAAAAMPIETPTASERGLRTS